MKDSAGVFAVASMGQQLRGHTTKGADAVTEGSKSNVERGNWQMMDQAICTGCGQYDSRLDGDGGISELKQFSNSASGGFFSVWIDYQKSINWRPD
jgi:hypothetical protein